MKLNASNILHNGRWMSLASYYISHPNQLKKIIADVQDYASKDGLHKVKEDVFTLYFYVRDIVTGKYKDYNPANLLLVVAALIYLVTPTDVIPDFLPVGFVDDVSVIGWVITQVSDEIKHYMDYKSNNP
ncbi:MAG: DUF1232 domain-containing protein [Bacteroidaceae bacterium]|nr:DUF1232 domain-containing protein [Bacteroidaceae bacterium]